MEMGIGEFTACESRIDVWTALHQRRPLMVDSTLEHPDGIIIGYQPLNPNWIVGFLFECPSVQRVDQI